VDGAIKDYIRLHPGAVLIIYIEYSPNSMTLWKNIKDKLGKGQNKKIVCDANDFKLKPGYTQESLNRDINL